MNPETPKQPDGDVNATASEWEMMEPAAEAEKDREKSSAELQAEYEKIEAERDEFIKTHGRDNVPREKWSEWDEKEAENRNKYMEARMREVAELIPEKHREAFMENEGFRMVIDRVEVIVRMHNSGMSAEEIKTELSKTASDDWSIERIKNRVDNVFEYLTE